MLCARSAATGQAVEIEIENGRLRRVASTGRDPGGVWVAPGMIDLQVNGFAGVDYNDPATPLEEIARSIRAQRGAGVARLLPTVITGSHERMRDALRNLARAREQLEEGHSIAGFHVEGPFLAAEDGPRGAHPRQHIRPPDREEFERLQEAAQGGVRLLTLAPELPGALELIEHAAGRGVVVSLGHTGASPQRIQEAVRAGATMSTHLGNGSHGTLPRHPNYIWEQLAADELYAGLIVDGIHLPPAFVKCAVRAKGLQKSVLVTDASSPAGCAPGRYRLGEVDVELTPENRVQIAGTRQLAGSALRMDRGVENVMKFAGLPLEAALRLATSNPARALGLRGRAGFLEPGDIADLMLFRFDPAGPGLTVEQLRCAPREAWHA